MIDETAAIEYAEQLFASHREQGKFEPLSKLRDEASLADAYRIQGHLVRLFEQAHAANQERFIAGYKIALTSKAMQDFVRVDQPVAGRVFKHTVLESPASLRLEQFGHLGVEFEVAVELAVDLERGSAAFTRESVAGAVGLCYPAFELIDDRNADYADIDAFSLTADNAWNAGVILGTAVDDWRDVDFVDGPTRLWTDGQADGEGRIGDALGHPFEALAWLANRASEYGIQLRAGDLVLTGSSITTRFPQQSCHYRFAIDGLGEVQLQLD